MTPILLERQCKLVVGPVEGKPKNNLIVALTMMKNLESLGFVLSERLFNEMRFQPTPVLNQYYQIMIPVLKRMTGSHVEHKPFYENFHQQLLEFSEVELYLNAFFHYLTLGAWKPEYERRLRFPLVEGKPQIRLIDIGSYEDFYAIFVNLMAAKGSLSQTDSDLLVWFIENLDTQTMVSLLPAQIPSKETLGVVARAILQFHKPASASIKTYFKTATDVLRLAVSMSDGHVSLSSKTKFRSFSRSERS